MLPPFAWSLFFSRLLGVFHVKNNASLRSKTACANPVVAKKRRSISSSPTGNAENASRKKRHPRKRRVMCTVVPIEEAFSHADDYHEKCSSGQNSRHYFEEICAAALFRADNFLPDLNNYVLEACRAKRRYPQPIFKAVPNTTTMEVCDSTRAVHTTATAAASLPGCFSTVHPNTRGTAQRCRTRVSF